MQSPSRSPSLLAQFDFVAPLTRNWALLWQFTQRNVELRHKGSHLGLVWSFLNPLLMLGLYYYVFGVLGKGSFNAVPNETRQDFALGIFLGLSLFHFVSEVMGVAPTVIVGQPNFVKKVVFPLEILPVATVGASFFHFLVSIGLTLLGITFFGPGLHLGMLWLPVIFLPVLLFGLGLAWFISAIGVFFRDVGQFMGFLSMVVMFTSAVFNGAKSFGPTAWSILRFNPLIHAIEQARHAALWQLPVDMNALAYLYAAGIVACLGGYFVFQKLRPAFADVL